MVKATQRCSWCGDDPLYVRYHDREWGVPTRDRHELFELLMLEGQQAGLSWITVLRKRRHMRGVLFGFCPDLLARMGDRDVARLLKDPGVIRHRGKIEALRTNAQRFLELDRDGGAVEFLWSFVDGRPRVNRRRASRQIPPRTPQSDSMARALKKSGFKFVGSTICYAFMQAAGMVNDHVTTCFRHLQCGEAGVRRRTIV